jgi:hypothetical protein
MTKEQYLAFHADFCRDMVEITKRKNSDYTGDNGDPFKNFKMVEEFGVATAEQGLFTRMTDKMARLGTFVSGKELQVTDESVIDTLKDLSNYSAILAALIKSKKSS